MTDKQYNNLMNAGIYTKNIIVTPMIAVEWLKKSEGNRAINKTRVEAYARDLLMDKWRPGSTIKFDAAGVLIDGHHRLNAIVWSGVEALFLVTFNLPENARTGINLAKAWTPEEISHVMGENFGKRHFSIAQYLEFGVSSFGGRIIPTFTEKRELVIKYLDALDFTVGIAGHNKYVSNPVLGAVARAYYSRDPQRIEEFVEVVRSGALKDPNGDIAAVFLRNWIIEAQNKGHQPDRYALYKRAEKALVYFCDRKPLKKLYAAEKELFPLKLNDDGKVVPE